MPFFLSHPLPAEVALRSGEAWLARPHIDPAPWLDGRRIRLEDIMGQGRASPVAA